MYLYILYLFSLNYKKDDKMVMDIIFKISWYGQIRRENTNDVFQGLLIRYWV